MALMALAIAVPGVASATDDNPLSDVPPEFEPALEAVAGELGISADKLQSASREELQTLLCSELEGESPEDVAARVEAALSEVPDEQLEGVSEVERQALEAQLPTLVSQLKTACEDAVTDTDATDDSEADESDDDVPVPNRVDAGGGGVNETSASVPVVFGGIFAAVFGLFGIAIIGMRRRA